MEAVFCFVEDDGGGPVDDVGGDFVAAVGGKAVQEDSVGISLIHGVGVDGVRLEDLGAGFFFVLLAHGDPGVGDDDVGAGQGLVGVGRDQD